MNQNDQSAYIGSNVGDLYDIEISPDGKWFFTASSLGVKRWNLKDGQESLLLSTNSSQHVQSLLSSPDARWLAGWTQENSLIFWDLKRPDFTENSHADYTIPYAKSYATNDASDLLA